MFGPDHYVPLLLTKRGERQALGDVDASVKAHMTPLFVIAPQDWDFDLGQPKKSVDAHHAQTGKDLASCWGSAPAFVDAFFSDDLDSMVNGQHPLEHVIEQGNAHGAQLIPCVNNDHSASFRAKVAAIQARDGRGICIRLDTQQWPSAIGTPALDQLVMDCGVTPTSVDLVLDLGEEAVAVPVATTAARAELLALPHANEWRSVTLAGGGFPKELGANRGYGKGISMVDRAEWQVYSALRAGVLPRTPTFGDYVIANPDPVVDVDPRFMQISATFRYTVPGQWLIAKGDLFKGRAGTGQGGAAMLPVAQSITAHAAFLGASHCAGDVWLQGVASGSSGGNPEQWRRAGTSHHLTQLVGEIASLPAPSTAPSPGAGVP